LLLIDEDATLAAIPDLLPSDHSGPPARAFVTLRQILSASGAVTGDAAERLQAHSPALRCGSRIGPSVGRRVMLAFRTAQR
jgi:hypothetical protein